ncbi:MAG: helix-turn-helix domain-containing protein, partial [Candidatus Eisenbacteria bacterium]|nr:helix-turn-helix domain-containing protein [Candidatus Eisenbacteria bacterium]
YARRKSAAKRGGHQQKVTLNSSQIVGGQPALDTLRLDRALTKLEQKDARMARVAELKAFAGMSVQQVAAVLGVSRRTVDSDWAVARTWLAHEMARD